MIYFRPPIVTITIRKKLVRKESEGEVKHDHESMDSSFTEESEEGKRSEMEKQLSDSSMQSLSAKLKFLTSSPVVLRKSRRNRMNWRGCQRLYPEVRSQLSYTISC
ncbi:hypothetical protein JTB14_012518 [Gonioctena quinquepunctata]|nr:hypothetical protein JTB14_012518 [Gonioctena quinquepunctata]